MHLAALVLLSACSDYTIEGDKPEPHFEDDPVLVPDAEVSPGEIDLGIVCGAMDDVTVDVSNVGTGPLTVRGAEVSGDGWTLAENAFPATVEPGESITLTLVPGAGTAVLEIATDDPAGSELRVPLQATADAPPTVSIVTPTGGDVLPGDATATFSGLVSDDADAADALTLAWTSTVDGVLGTDPAAATGETSVSWDPSARTAGVHTVTLAATDSCGQTTEAVVSLCQDQGYTADNLDLSTWNFEGTARYDSSNGWVEITGPYENQGGSAFQTAATVGAENVSIAFGFFVSGGSGADGMSVTAIDSSRMTSFVGSTGGGIGYMGLPGWSIEVDTYYNGDYGDPTTEDHVSIHFDGDLTNPVAWATLPEMEDGAWHTMEVEVLAPHVTVTIDGTDYIDQDLTGFTAFPAYVGFTAATGSLTNYHLVDALTVTRNVCDEG